MMTAITGTTGRVLGYLHRRSDFGAAARTEVCPATSLLQIAVKRACPAPRSRAHRHLPQPRATEGTSEAWIVVTGWAEVSVGDDAKRFPFAVIVLEVGDCYVSVAGFHALWFGDRETCVYEIKNGPYNGQAADKEWGEE